MPSPLALRSSLAASAELSPSPAAASQTPDLAPRRTVHALGLPILPVTFAETLDAIDRLIAEGQPNYFITANLHYAMLSSRDERLKAVNREAAFLLADGFPLLWAARLNGQRLPERVTGSDLIYKLAERAAQKGHKIFFLGGAPGVADAAASELCRRYPGLQIAGVEVPPFRAPTAEENARLVERIRESEADVLLVALGQPKGELWLWENRQALGVPAAVRVEWAYRMRREPKRLAPRYFQDALFLLRRAFVGLFTCCRRKPEEDSDKA